MNYLKQSATSPRLGERPCKLEAGENISFKGDQHIQLTGSRASQATLCVSLVPEYVAQVAPYYLS